MASIRFSLLCFCSLTVISASVAVLPEKDDDIREIQSSIIQQLNQNRHLNAIEQNKEVQSLLDALEPETRQRYELWISELQELEKEKSKKLRVRLFCVSRRKT